MGSIYFSKRIPQRTPRKRSASRIRSKTYKSEESAKKDAERLGLKNYKLENLRSETANVKKIRILKED